MKAETLQDTAETLPLIPEKTLATAEHTIGWRVYVFMLGVFIAKGFSEAFPALALTYFTKDTLGLSPSMATQVGSLLSIPWVIKPLYGFFTDNFPIFGMHRIPYIILSFLVVSACWFIMAYGVSSVSGYIIVILLSNTAMATAFVCGEAVVVEHSDAGSTEASNTLQTVVWGAAMAGSTVGGIIGNTLEALASAKLVFTVVAIVPLVAIPFIWQPSVERPPQERQHISVYFSTLWETAKQPHMLKPAIFIFLFQMMPSMGSTGFYYYTNQLQMDKDTMALLGSVTQVCGLLGMGLYYTFCRGYSAKPVILWGTLAVNAITASQLLLFTGYNRKIGIPDEAFVFADSALITVVAMILMVPLLSLMAQLCPKGLEGTVFSFYTALYNLGGIVSGQLSALLQDALGITSTNFDNIVVLRIITLVLQTMPLLFLWLLPEIQDVTDAEPEASIAPVTGAPINSDAIVVEPVFSKDDIAKHDMVPVTCPSYDDAVSDGVKDAKGSSLL